MARPSRSRTPEQTDAISQAGIDTDALDASAQALDTVSAHTALLDERFGTGIAYSFEVYVSRLRNLMQETGARLVEMGLMLIQIREREPHGQFTAALTSTGIPPRFAQRCMQAATKFGADARGKQLAAQLGSAKVLELLSEDDDDIAELADGGTLAGYSADEIDAMSTRELRAALRKEREERDQEKSADSEIIAKKDERIHKLMRERRVSAKSPAAEQAKPLLGEMDELCIELGQDMTDLRAVIDRIEATFAEAGEEVPTHVIERIDANRKFVADWLGVITADLGE